MTTDATVPPTSFTAALRAAGTHERIVAILGEVVAASAARPAFANGAAFEPAGAVVPLAAGPARPRLLCVPAFMPGSGAIQFAWLAQAFRGARDVAVVPLPGFARGERL
ncbi:MAG TPA: hypothetical protein VFS37_06435, partial [Conexibacter sp.]|nr:hypothetical protein [Conexibacter sp.]